MFRSRSWFPARLVFQFCREWPDASPVRNREHAEMTLCRYSTDKMRVFLCGSELGLGLVVGQRLLAEGHKVTMLTTYEDLIPNELQYPSAFYSFSKAIGWTEKGTKRITARRRDFKPIIDCNYAAHAQPFPRFRTNGCHVLPLFLDTCIPPLAPPPAKAAVMDSTATVLSALNPTAEKTM